MNKAQIMEMCKEWLFALVVITIFVTVFIGIVYIGNM